MISKAIIIGAGGTGSHLIPALVRLLKYHPVSREARVVVYDGDEFAEHNVNRQCVSRDNVGRNKAEVMAELCAWHGFRIQAKPNFITEQRLMRELDGQAFPVVIAAVDNNSTRLMSLRCCEEQPRYFWASPGNSDTAEGDHIHGQVMWSSRNDTGRCGLSLQELVDLYPDLAVQDPMPRDGGCAHLAPSTPQIITANVMAASCTLAVVQNLLDDTLPEGKHTTCFNARSDVRALSV